MFNAIKRKKQSVPVAVKNDFVLGDLICQNDLVTAISDACSICYDVKRVRSMSTEERKDYITRRLAVGHESVLEHGNLVMLLQFNEGNLYDALKLGSVCNFLHYRTIKKNGKFYMLLGGTLHGFKQIFRNIKNLNNSLLGEVKSNLYLTDKCFFGDFIEKGIMDEDEFDRMQHTVKTYNVSDKATHGPSTIYNMESVKILIDYLNLAHLYNNDSVTAEDAFCLNDLLDMITVTVFYKDISRIISQQLTRHRAGITQASQRYIDYGKPEFQKFNAPELFKEKYEKNKKYKVKVMIAGQEHEFEGTQEEIGLGIVKLYPQFRDQGLDKEDARAFSPNNVVTSLYMTYTLRQLIFVIHLRTEGGAQAEAQQIFQNVKTGYEELAAIGFKYDDLVKYIAPIFEIVEMNAVNELEALEDAEDVEE